MSVEPVRVPERKPNESSTNRNEAGTHQHTIQSASAPPFAWQLHYHLGNSHCICGCCTLNNEDPIEMLQCQKSRYLFCEKIFHTIIATMISRTKLFHTQPTEMKLHERKKNLSARVQRATQENSKKVLNTYIAFEAVHVITSTILLN
jgi:hypothetical protein